MQLIEAPALGIVVLTGVSDSWSSGLTPVTDKDKVGIT